MLNKHADPSDMASDYTLEVTEAQLARREKPPEEVKRPLMEEELECEHEDCENILPEKRRLAGYTLCVECKERLEREEERQRLGLA